jgi:hypothetical protein
MFILYGPDRQNMREVQDRESSYYWSALAASLLRASGVVSVVDASLPIDPAEIERMNGVTAVVLRGMNAGINFTMGSAAVLEAPLDDAVASAIGVPTRNRITLDHATLFDAHGKPLGLVHRQRVRVRAPDREIRRPKPDDSLWQMEDFPVEVWPDNAGDVLMRLDLGDGVSIPAAIRIGAVLIFTFPIFDVLGGWLGFPPLTERYAGFHGGGAPTAALKACVDLMKAHHLTVNDGPLVEARAFPDPYTCALSVRHDYDRAIDDSSWRELLNYYNRRGIGASFGILTYLMPSRVLDWIEDAGQEIQLHCFAHDEHDLRDQADLVSRLIAQPLDGVTIHGGPAGIGFRGDTHFAFFERAGFTITEAYGMRGIPIAPIARIVDGAPRSSARLAAPPFHLSLDGSTRPGDHKLDMLLRAIPAALDANEYVVLMNHPDIHREALYTLLDSLDLSNCWTPTIRQAIRFSRSTRLNSNVRAIGSGLRIALGEPLEEEAVFEISRRNESPSPVRIPPGAMAAVF